MIERGGFLFYTRGSRMTSTKMILRDGIKNLDETGIWEKSIPGQGDNNRKDPRLGISRNMLRELKRKQSVCCDCSV